MSRKTHHVLSAGMGWKVVKGGFKRASWQFIHEQVAVSMARELRAEYPRNGHKLIDSMMQSNCSEVPSVPLDQIRLMGFLTGSHQNLDSEATATLKDSYVLTDAVHNLKSGLTSRREIHTPWCSRGCHHDLFGAGGMS